MSVTQNSKLRSIWYNAARTSGPGPVKLQSASGAVVGGFRAPRTTATSRVPAPPPDLTNRRGVWQRIWNPKLDRAGTAASPSSASSIMESGAAGGPHKREELAG